MSSSKTPNKSYDTIENKSNHISSIKYNDNSKTIYKTTSYTSRSSLQGEFPSLTPDIPKPNLNAIEFATSVPIFRRTKFDLFGLLDKEKEIEPSIKEARYNSPDKSPLLTPIIKPSSPNNMISTPPNIGGIPRQSESREKAKERFNAREIQAKKLIALRNERKAIEKASELNPLVRKSKQKRRESVGYNIKLNTDTDALMMDEEVRKKKLALAQLKKKDSFLIKQRTTRNRKVDTPNKQLNKNDSLSFSSGGFISSTVGYNNADEQKEKGLDIENDELAGKMDHYFGHVAKQQFNYKFKYSTKNLERFIDDRQLPDHLNSPRSLYLREVAKSKLLPLPLLLRKDNNPVGIHLGHRGLGDERFMPVVTVMENLPAVHTIDLCDNRLTDITLMPLASKLHHFKSLTYLDLSFNKMDDSSATIMDFLKDKECKLETLLLNGADVDDSECKNLAEAISLNTSIKTLGLAKNLIGQAELLNVLYPDMITGGEALGDMLRVNTTLTELDLSWNSIRLDSAIAIALALEVNSTLNTLLLAYNSFGDMPSQILGRTLKVNKGLTVLDIESNSLTPKAATVLANSISFNETLLKLNINGNVLGKIGAQALVAAIQRSSRENRALQVSFVNCDCVMDEGNIFSAGNPHGTWKLNLKEPYGQMVAAECLYLANYKAGCRIVRLYYQNAPVILERSYVVKLEDGEAGLLKKFKLDEFYKNSRIAANEMIAGNFEEASKALNILLLQFDFKMEDEQRMQVILKTNDLWTAKAKREGRDDLQEVFLYEVFFALFVINDVDMSGTMELDEFLETLASLGKPGFDPEAAKRLMDEHDKDESGSIDANEFGMIMLKEFCQTDLPKGDLVDASTGLPWEIPPSGYCVIQLSYQCDVPTLFDIGEDHGIDNIIQSIRNAKTDEQKEILFQNTTSSPYFFLSFDQAQLLFEEMQALNRLPLDLMANILPQIVNEDQAIKFVDANLNSRGKFALRIKLGQLYNSYVGLHTGHYAIDMKQPDQRNGGRRLGAISVTEGKFARQAGTNSSQKGNKCNFRNEKLGVTPVDVTGRWFASVNTNKTLHCDYVSTMKPNKGTAPMTDARLERIISDLELETIRTTWNRLMELKAEFIRKQEEDSIREEEEASRNDSLDGDTIGFDDENDLNEETEKLENLSLNGSIRNTGSGNNSVSSKIKATSISTSSMKENISTKENEAVTNDESISTKVGRKKKDLGPLPFTQIIPDLYYDIKDFPELEIESPLSHAVLKDAYTEYMDTCHHFYDIYPEERLRDVSRPSYTALLPGERPVTPEGMKMPPPPPKTYLSPIYPLGYKRLVQIQIMMPGLYMTIEQLSVLLEYFPPEEGYLRIQLIQSVFSHIVDLENLYRIYDNVLTEDERIELLHRVGIMNVLDPLKPDRFYKLDLRRYDHREWAKILVTLSVAEPGENWEHLTYRWGRYDEPVPGWILPGPWAAADDGGINGGPRNHGWLCLYYRSIGNGCFPVMSVRKYLRKRTLAGMKKIL